MAKNFKSYLLKKFPVITVLIDWSKKIILPGFDRLPVYDVAIFFFRGIQKGALTMRASALAFNFFLAIFPAIIFLFTLIPYIPIENFQKELLIQLKLVLPEEAYILAISTIEDLVNTPHGGLLSFGFILAMYFATNGINAMMDAFNQSVHIAEKRSFFHQQLISILLVFIQSFLLIIAIALLVFGQITLDFLNEKEIIESGINIFLLTAGQWITIAALFYFAISFLYYFGPSIRGKWKFFSAGSTLATILMIIVSSGFAFYVNNFGQYNKVYGSIGTLIVIMLWIQFNSIILLIGFELNASIRNAKHKHFSKE